MKLRSYDATSTLRRATVVAGFALLVVVALQGCGGQNGSGSSDDSAIAEGRRLFVANCTVCHGEDGDKVAQAPLDHKEFLDSLGDAMLVHVIGEGKGIMPAWAKSANGPLTPEQIDAVVAYLNSAAGRSSPSLLANSGRNVFQQNCSRCHGDKGDRIPVAPLAAKPFLDSFNDDQLFQVIGDGVGLMPAFRTGVSSPLSLDQVKAVVSYLHYNAEVNLTDLARQGRDLFVSNCLPCHGEQGDKVPGVALASVNQLRKLGDGGITSTIGNGKGVMPAFASSRGGSFNVAELAAILAYLKSLAGLPAGAALAVTQTTDQDKSLYAANCTGCHGDNGDKVAGVSLKNATFLDDRSDDVLERQIRQGNAHGMPAWGQPSGGPLSDAGIKNLIAYLRTEAKNAPLATRPTTPQPDGAPAANNTAARGKELFRQNCAACHGESRDKVAAANLADSAWLQQRGDDVLAQSIAFGMGAMPSWGKERGGPLSANDIASLINYLKAVAGTAPATATAIDKQSPPAAPITALSADASAGRALYTKNCVACHGDSRDKLASAKLADATWLQQRGDAALIQSISNGKGGMPSWSKDKGGMLNPQDIVALIAYLKEAAGMPASPTQDAATPVAQPATTAKDEPTATPAPTKQAAPPATAAPTAAQAPAAAPAAANASHGKELFTKTCTACHGDNGARLTTAKLADAAWLQQRGDAALSQSIAQGKGGMPAWGKAKGGQLSDQDIADIIAYLKAAAGG